MGSLVVNAILPSPAEVKSIGISMPALFAISAAQVSTPSIARSTSTFASIRGFPPSEAISKASSSALPFMISAVFFNTAILSCFGSPFLFALCVFSAMANAVSTSLADDSFTSPTGEPSKGLVTSNRCIIESLIQLACDLSNQ